jgi:acyl-CoA synthetase (AMP-forming)/AMP-acid ligase II
MNRSIPDHVTVGLPVSLLAPAVASIGAYANAKYGIWSDLTFIGRFVGVGRYMSKVEKNDQVNMFYMFEAQAKDSKAASRPFLLLPPDGSDPNKQTVWTYAEAYEMVLRYAAYLREEYKVQKNEVVAMDFTNKPQFLWMWFALWSLGAIPAFINTNLRDKAFVHSVRVSTGRILFVDPSIREVLSDSAASELAASNDGRGIETVILEETTHNDILKRTPYRAPNEARSGRKMKDSALLIYTSGTTGLPKAAHVPWDKPRGAAMGVGKILQLRPSDRFFSAMPLYHTAASLLCVCATVGVGCTYVMSPRFSPRTFMRQATETEATAMQYIGEMCRYLTVSPPTPYDRAHKLRVAFGNGLRQDVWQPFKDRFALDSIVELYGATEGIGATVNVSRNTFSRGAIGRTSLISGVINNLGQALLKFDNEAEEPLRNPRTGLCSRSAYDQPGEFVAKLDPKAIKDKFLGYLGNEKATNSKILRDVFTKGDAWYRTGDLLRQDSEGRLWFVDRIGDTYRWKGENVSTAEVSEALGSHPSVREANVYGVTLPGHDGRAGCAALLLRDGQTLDESLRRDLAAHVRKQLPKYAVPLFLRLVKGELEITGTVKQTKVQLRNEGVDPESVGEDQVLWLPGQDGYEPFAKKDWEALVGGQAKL